MEVDTCQFIIIFSFLLPATSSVVACFLLQPKRVPSFTAYNTRMQLVEECLLTENGCTRTYVCIVNVYFLLSYCFDTACRAAFVHQTTGSTIMGFKAPH